jgi:hypothetical protein
MASLYKSRRVAVTVASSCTPFSNSVHIRRIHKSSSFHVTQRSVRHRLLCHPAQICRITGWRTQRPHPIYVCGRANESILLCHVPCNPNHAQYICISNLCSLPVPPLSVAVNGLSRIQSLLLNLLRRLSYGIEYPFLSARPDISCKALGISSDTQLSVLAPAAPFLFRPSRSSRTPRRSCPVLPPSVFLGSHSHTQPTSRCTTSTNLIKLS